MENQLSNTEGRLRIRDVFVNLFGSVVSVEAGDGTVYDMPAEVAFDRRVSGLHIVAGEVPVQLVEVMAAEKELETA